MKKGGAEKKAFSFKVLGQLASIGYHNGVAKVFGCQFSGVTAWLVWKATYLFKLPTFEKKLRVLSNWIMNIFFRRDLVQFLSMDSIRIAETRKRKFFEWKESQSVQDIELSNGSNSVIQNRAAAKS